jgi:hypothetical protein
MPQISQQHPLCVAVMHPKKIHGLCCCCALLPKCGMLRRISHSHGSPSHDWVFLTGYKWRQTILGTQLRTSSEEHIYLFFYPFFSPISWYPIGSYSLVSSLQLPYKLGRGEGREPCVLRNTTQQSRTASWHNAYLTWKPATPMCRRKHRTPGDRVSLHYAQPATGVAGARWDIPAGQTLP